MNIKTGKFYKSLINEEFVRIDGFDEDETPIGVVFESFDNYISLASNTYLDITFDTRKYQEITEKEFYTALDLVKEQFIKSFKTINKK